MRVLFTTQSTSGHYHPLAPYARALEEAGHEIAFAAAGAYGEFHTAMKTAGFRSFSAGELRRQPEIMAEIQREHPNADAGERVSLRFQKLFLEQSALTMARDLTPIAERWSPDLIIRETREFGGWAFAEHCGIPHVTAGAPILWPPDRWAEIADLPLKRLQHGLGIDGELDASSLYRYLDLDPFPPSLLVNADYLHPVSHLVRPALFDQPHGEPLPGWVADLPDRPTVYGSLGTTNFSRVPGAFEAMAEGLAGEPYNVILTVGWDRDPAEVDRTPPTSTSSDTFRCRCCSLIAMRSSATAASEQRLQR